MLEIYLLFKTTVCITKYTMPIPKEFLLSSVMENANTKIQYSKKALIQQIQNAAIHSHNPHATIHMLDPKLKENL